MIGPLSGLALSLIFFHRSSEHLKKQRRNIIHWFYASHHIQSSIVFEKELSVQYGGRELYFSDYFDRSKNPTNEEMYEINTQGQQARNLW